MTDKVHIFELAGLGKRPFDLTGYHQYTDDNKGRCDYCNTQIVHAFWVESSDNKIFKVGSECVKKTNDDGLLRTLKQQAKRIKKERDMQFIEENEARFLEHIETLKDKPHPNAFMAEQGNSLRDYLEFQYKHGGVAVKVKLIKELDNE